jgi:MurNAc alpha-1-phosphate uridylyltransferase
MILAAGRGERMRPLTDHCPKPLLAVGGRSLIEWHLIGLARAGIHEVVINHAHLGSLIEAALGNGSRWGVKIAYSAEHTALETAGGIRRALPLLGPDPFLVVNGDIHCSFNFTRALTIAQQMTLAHLSCWCVLVDNPAHHPRGDFGLQSGLLEAPESIQEGDRRLTFSGIGLYRPELVSGLRDGEPARLAPLLAAQAALRRAGAEYHAGHWADVGTPERLRALDKRFSRTTQPEEC